MSRLHRTRIFFALADLVLVFTGIVVTAWIHDGRHLIARWENHLFAYIAFPVLWMTLSAVTRKFRAGEGKSRTEVMLSVLYSNFLILSVTTIIMVFFRQTYFSRFILFGTVAGITLFELAFASFYLAIKKSVFIKDWIGLEIPRELAQGPVPPKFPGIHAAPQQYGPLREAITEEAGRDASEWIEKALDITDPGTLIISTDTRFNILHLPSEHYASLVNLHRVNDLRRINKFFETVNAVLPVNGLFIGCGETNELRKHRILRKYLPPFNYAIYLADFILHRVLPKLTLTKKLYFLLTGGKKRAISRTEMLGRLYSCGFSVLEEFTASHYLYWKARKVREPYYDNDPTYGLFIHLRRIGRNGREFNVYKLRTMHAYAEYLQGYVYEHHQLDEGGKFRNDFRITPSGRIFRKFWLDELPMILNVLKGDMKIVGVRPLSRHYFDLYSPELRERRIRTRPGLIPPFYAQHPTPRTLEEVQQNEMAYLEAWERHPFRTDVVTFFRALHNIFWKRARSK